MSSTTGSATTRDGLRLLTRHWAPTGEPWARVLIVHGLSEHSGRHDRVGGWFAAAGVDAHAYDQRGWGGSDGRRGDVDRWDRLLDDLAERVDAARGEPPAGLPLVLYGHSMGGLVCAGYVTAGGRPMPDLLVLSAPGIDSTHSRVVRIVAATAGRIAPTSRPPVVPDHAELLCHDPEVGRAFRADPVAVHDPTSRFGALAFAEQRAVRDRLDRMIAEGRPLPVPTLVIHGADDPIVPAGSSARFESFAGADRRVYPGLRHEIHHEAEGPAIYADVVAWIAARTGRGTAAGASATDRPAERPPARAEVGAAG